MAQTNMMRLQAFESILERVDNTLRQRGFEYGLIQTHMIWVTAGLLIAKPMPNDYLYVDTGDKKIAKEGNGFFSSHTLIPQDIMTPWMISSYSDLLRNIYEFERKGLNFRAYSEFSGQFNERSSKKLNRELKFLITGYIVCGVDIGMDVYKFAYISATADNLMFRSEPSAQDEQPVYQRPRRISYEDQRWVDQQVAEWLRDGIIRPSCSAYASPIILVSKKDGSKRMCCDYRKLNEKILRDNFPMPLMDEVIERLQQAKIYSTLDLKDGFFHVPLDEQSTKYTAFVTQKGQYEFNYVPFGICNSPAVFTRFIMAIMRKFIEQGIVVLYMDDIIIPSKDEQEGIEKLKVVLDEASKYGLKIKWKKCQFLRSTVNYLGYIVSNGTIRPSKEKLKAVEDFPVPTTKQAVQRFIGLTSYFRRFVENYAMVARPLTELLKKDACFKIGDEQMLAMQQLKEALVKAPVLKLFNVAAKTEIHTDACMYGYGGVLLQLDSDDQQYHPVQYMSRKTKPAEEKLHSYELEVLAVIEALKKWRVYVIGKKFKIITDCNAFTMTMKKKDIPAKIARWAIFLQDFDYEIEHRSGSKMRHVDALSRAYCMFLEDSLKHKLKQAQLGDEWIRAVRSLLENNLEYDDYYLKADVLHKDAIKQLIVVPIAMENEIIKMAHRQGHYAAKKTQEIIEKNYFIPHLGNKVEKVLRNCVECIITNAKLGKKEGLLVPIDKGDRPLITFHLDHVGPMEMTKKCYNYILVIVDGFSKFVWLFPTKSTGSEEVLRCMQQQASVFGHPLRCITDRGTAFTSHLFEEYCVTNGIQHLTIATGVPRGNGQVERMHKILVPMLSKISVSKPDHWYKSVPSVQQMINNTPSRSCGQSPFRILTGVNMRINCNPQLQEILEQEMVEELDRGRNEMRNEVRERILAIQQENCKSFNKNRKMGSSYEVDELVAIKRTQYGTAMKLRPKFLGPYRVVKVLKHGRYDVEKVGEHEGPLKTTSVAENMKKWTDSFEVE